ncbi:GntR family transcriptional regulator [Microlunatus parietis]|uniref:DNA-binding GntR family transcriptional regulator n=1 Tax=Microlunatus parietis TaxID=682979 RepID=A0A7Y9ICD8_9ACTN|nr:GntR family transcriptional regulator [Microlunatus parietis]NYE74016.1 DNA-binding GntR family transcriptional regulator [Microlunatus parietis]
MANDGGFEPESARVTRQLRDDIIDGVRPSGSKLVERDLANELGVSRIPVRDALRALVAEGLVVQRPRTWAVVREFTPADIADLSEVRSAFEELTFRLAAQRHDRAGLRRLQAVLEAEIEAARAGDAVRARRAAADFHEVVTDLSGNELLIELGQNLRSRMRWLLTQHDDLELVAAEHERLYLAVADRDVARVAELVRQHLETSRYLSRAGRSADGSSSRVD